MDWLLVAGGIIAFVLGGVLSYHFFKTKHHLNMLKRQNDMQSRLQSENARVREELARVQVISEGGAKELQVLNEQLQLLRSNKEQLQQQMATKQADMSALTVELEQKSLSHDKELAVLKEAKQQLSKEFESLANRIFDEKTERFSKTSQLSLDGALKPLKEQLTDFKKKVEEVYDKETRDRVSLVAELAQLKQLNQKMSEDAVNLTKALKGDNKAQGNWGEVILERVLEESGLRKGHEYHTQVSMTSAEGERRAPDVVVHLPENKDIVIDSKVSLLDYDRYCSASNEDERQTSLKAHAQSVRNHIIQLSKKNYQDLEGLQTLDFVFIFIPVESAFMAAFEYDQAMYRDAYEKNIIIVGPTTLLATLRTVQSIWRHERQNKNVEEIARQAGAMHDRFVNFVEDLNKISQHLDKATEAHAAAMKKLSTGRGNLVGSTLKLEKLGAKTKKKIPDVVISDDALSECDESITLIETPSEEV